MPPVGRNDFAFGALGAVIGLLIAFGVKAGTLPRFDSGTVFLAVVAPLGVIEVATTYIKGLPPGTLVSMPGRLLGLVAGVVAYFGLMAA